MHAWRLKIVVCRQNGHFIFVKTQAMPSNTFFNENLGRQLAARQGSVLRQNMTNFPVQTYQEKKDVHQNY